MKGFRFHAVMPSERRSKAASKKYPRDPFTVRRLEYIAAEGGRCEVFALSTEDVCGRPWGYYPGGVSTYIEGVYGSLGFGNCSIEWLAKRTVRISEALARQLHPEIFTYLESD